MSRFKPKAVRIKKPLSKVEQALRMARSNKRKLGDYLEVFSAAATVASDVALSSTPTVLLLIANMGMSGNKTTLKSVQVRAVVKQNLTSALIDDYRVDLVIDRAPAGVAITPLLYLGDATPNITAYKDFDGKGRYKILKTWSGYLSSSEGSNSFRKINSYVRLNLKSETNQFDQYAQGNLIKNALYLVRWTTASANQPTFKGDIRVVFADTLT